MLYEYNEILFYNTYSFKLSNDKRATKKSTYILYLILMCFSRNQNIQKKK